VSRIGCAIVGQSRRLVPADGRLYALRDVTATVNAVPLIASSIMSKKLAAGAQTIVLDVKYGSGAFMETRDAARELARAMVAIGQGAGRDVRAVLSGMEEPLGSAVGNALEVREAIETLHGRGPEDLWTLTVELGAHLLELAGVAGSPEVAREEMERLRADGSALEKLRELVRAQGGDAAVVEILASCPPHRWCARFRWRARHRGGWRGSMRVPWPMPPSRSAPGDGARMTSSTSRWGCSCSPGAATGSSRAIPSRRSTQPRRRMRAGPQGRSVTPSPSQRSRWSAPRSRTRPCCTDRLPGDRTTSPPLRPTAATALTADPTPDISKGTLLNERPSRCPGRCLRPCHRPPAKPLQSHPSS